MADPNEAIREALAEQYELLEVLGEGGMGIVYLARDVKHDRRVAIKTIRTHLPAAELRDRFEREIHVTAQLQHPNILPLHDSGTAGDTLYYVMPYVKGESLRERLTRGDTLPDRKVIQLGRDVASALDYAHRQDVIHRDIKPDNILLTSDRAVVADFGISKFVGEDAEAGLTRSGALVGTPAYMPLEQYGGEVTGQSDIYALGAVLYQALTGRRWLLGTIVDEADWTGVDPEIRSSLGTALQPSPQDRWEDAAAFRQALGQAGYGGVKSDVRGRRKWPVAVGVATLAAIAVAATVTLRSGGANGTDLAEAPGDRVTAIAVLPFRVQAIDTGVALLREGIVDLLNARLTVEGNLRAVSPTTLLRLWRRAVGEESEDLSELEALDLARSVGADRLLLGSFLETGVGLTANVRLLEVTGGAQVEAWEVVGSPEDPLALADGIAVRLLGRESGESDARATALSGRSLPAVQSFLSGQAAYRRGLFLEAVDHFDAALAADSGFALAALSLTLAGVWAGVPVSTAWPRGIPVLRRLASDLPPGDRRIADWLFAMSGDPVTRADALRNLQEAVNETPEDLDLLVLLGRNWLTFGRYLGRAGWAEAAHKALDRALEIDPGFLGALEWKRRLAFLTRDAAALGTSIQRHRAVLAAEGLPEPPWLAWQDAMLLGDAVGLDSLRAGLRSLEFGEFSRMTHASLFQGFATDDWEQAAQGFLARAVSTEELRRALAMRRGVALAVGRANRWIQDADSLARSGGPTRLQLLAPWAISMPGFDEVITAELESAEPTNYGLLCRVEVWRISRADTTHTRRSINTLNEMEGREERLNHCPVFLEAALGEPGALAAADSLSRLGAGLRSLNYLLALTWERAGDLEAALEAIRRRDFASWTGTTFLEPAYHREEGRLAALAGDTAGAVDAYARYLALRTDPDPGPMTDEVETVRAALARLLPDRGG